MPFSRSSARTASMISRLMSVPRSVVDQVPPHDRVVRDLHRLGALRRQLQAPLPGRDELATEALASADFAGRSQSDPTADGPLEVRGLAQRPLGARRGDVDGVLAQ